MNLAGTLALRVLLLMFSLGQIARAEEEPIPGGRWAGISVDKLPGHVVAPQGKLTLFADFEHKEKTTNKADAGAPDESVVLYIVNRTGKTLSLPSQDGDLYIKLEVLGENGLWERAQPHIYSDCGHSYIRVELKNNSYLMRSGFLPKANTKAKVRFRCHENIAMESAAPMVSNSGDGWIPQEAMLAARYDDMAVRTIPRAIISCFPRSEHMDKIWVSELPKLGEVTLARVAAALELLNNYDQAYFFRREAENLIDFEDTQGLAPETHQAIENIKRLLKGPWTKQGDSQALIERAVKALVTPEAGRKPATPESERLLTWCLLQEMAYGMLVDGYTKGGDVNLDYDQLLDEQPIQIAAELKQKLVDECRRVVREGVAEERGYATSLLASHGIGGGTVSDTELAELAGSGQQAVWHWALIGLAKSGNRDLLVNVARKRPEGDWCHVMNILAARIPEKMSDKEKQFWQDFGALDPGKFIDILEFKYRDLPVPEEFRNVVREYLAKEIANPSVTRTGEQPYYSLKSAIEFLHAGANPEDLTLIKKFLNHPLAEENHLSDGTVKISYPLQEFVKGLLEHKNDGPSLPGMPGF